MSSEEFLIVRSDNKEILIVRSDNKEILIVRSDNKEILIVRSDNKEILIVRSDNKEILILMSDNKEITYSELGWLGWVCVCVCGAKCLRWSTAAGLHTSAFQLRAECLRGQTAVTLRPLLGGIFSSRTSCVHPNDPKPHPGATSKDPVKNHSRTSTSSFF